MTQKEHILYVMAQVWSILLYPMWIPTYGMLLFCHAYSQNGLSIPIAYYRLIISSTLLFTALIPILIIHILRKMGKVSSMYIERAEERTIPYLTTATCYLTWFIFLRYTMHMPETIQRIVAGATLAIAIVALINIRWKISAHLTAIGGLIGAIASYHMCIGALPSILLITVLLLTTLLLMYARLYICAHTDTQVTAGLLLGLLTTFLPNFISNYV